MESQWATQAGTSRSFGTTEILSNFQEVCKGSGKSFWETGLVKVPPATSPMTSVSWSEHGHALVYTELLGGMGAGPPSLLTLINKARPLVHKDKLFLCSWKHWGKHSNAHTVKNDCFLRKFYDISNIICISLCVCLPMSVRVTHCFPGKKWRLQKFSRDKSRAQW